MVDGDEEAGRAAKVLIGLCEELSKMAQRLLRIPINTHCGTRAIPHREAARAQRKRLCCWRACAFLSLSDEQNARIYANLIYTSASRPTRRWLRRVLAARLVSSEKRSRFRFFTSEVGGRKRRRTHQKFRRNSTSASFLQHNRIVLGSKHSAWRLPNRDLATRRRPSLAKDAKGRRGPWPSPPARTPIRPLPTPPRRTSPSRRQHFSRATGRRDLEGREPTRSPPLRLPRLLHLPPHRHPRHPPRPHLLPCRHPRHLPRLPRLRPTIRPRDAAESLRANALNLQRSATPLPPPLRPSASMCSVSAPNRTTVGTSRPPRRSRRALCNGSSLKRSRPHLPYLTTFSASLMPSPPPPPQHALAAAPKCRLNTRKPSANVVNRLSALSGSDRLQTSLATNSMLFVP